MADVTIMIEEDGPYVVEGDVRIIDDDRRELDLPYDVELCRCGHSQNQPFCDGTMSRSISMEPLRTDHA